MLLVRQFLDVDTGFTKVELCNFAITVTVPLCKYSLLSSTSIILTTSSLLKWIGKSLVLAEYRFDFCSTFIYYSVDSDVKQKEDISKINDIIHNKKTIKSLK